MSGNGLPAARGEISAGVIEALRCSPEQAAGMPVRALRRASPYGDDLQLALYLCYELHYRGIAGVPDSWEWSPVLLELRAQLEARFLGALRDDVEPHADVDSALDELLAEPARGTGLSHFLREEGELWQLREYAALRSLYHLKEADPEVWAIPRLTGRAKAGLVTIEYDEYGAGRADRIHSPTISTGPSTSTGPPRSCQTRRGSPRSVIPPRYPVPARPHPAATARR